MSPVSGGDGAIVRFGMGKDVITIRRDDGVVVVGVEHEVRGDSVVAAIKRALEIGLLAPGDDALVDMTQFVGVIDWNAVHTVRDLADWGADPKKRGRVAYVVRNSSFANVVKVASVLFTRTSHRLFTDYAAALTWLKSFGKTER